MELINRIRDNQNYGMNIQNAINTAVNSCIADNIMKDFLTKHKAEVMSVCITEFDEKVFTDGIREEGREEGLAEGLAEGLSRGRQDGLKALIHSLRDFLPDFESVYQAMIRNTEYANISREQVQKYY